MGLAGDLFLYDLIRNSVSLQARAINQFPGCLFKGGLPASRAIISALWLAEFEIIRKRKFKILEAHMNLSGNTILITGGATGIGLALAERFLTQGNTVIICGRREDKLQEARQKHPDLHIRVADLAQESERSALFLWVKAVFPQVNVLVNNAGIQRRGALTDMKEPWGQYQTEIAINLEAPIHLSLLFLPHLQEQQNPAIINVTSGLAFSPLAIAPIYSATKAALHSFTLSLRQQLTHTGIKVLELIPPAVQTDLGAPGLHTFGAPLPEFADAMIAGLSRGEQEIGFGTSDINRKASRPELDEIFTRMNPT
jgi:uncharacterized oxidoreductase